MSQDPQKPRTDTAGDHTSKVEPSGPVSPPAPTDDPDGDETGGYEKRPRDSSTGNAKGGYGAG